MSHKADTIETRGGKAPHKKVKNNKSDYFLIETIECAELPFGELGPMKYWKNAKFGEEYTRSFQFRTDDNRYINITLKSGADERHLLAILTSNDSIKAKVDLKIKEVRNNNNDLYNTVIHAFPFFGDKPLKLTGSITIIEKEINDKDLKNQIQYANLQGWYTITEQF
jgi:hypothetical protein